MYLTRHVVTITTIADGSATAYTGLANGFVQAIRYVADANTAYTNTVDATITCETSGLPIVVWTNISATGQLMPRSPTHDAAGAALLYAAGGTPQSDPVPVANERVKIVLAQGGDTKTGVFHVYVG